ncbi:PopZ family protein [Aquamicrobium segne]|uniref:PopZ family protein n=1 Tax=Aquamicrobium segne TaxID=469547 RepID=A0ABW0GX98_9HYPH
MATASNIQREPSMEEILASIRRIIEDNDSGNIGDAGGTGLSGNTGRKPAENFGISAAETASAEEAPPVEVAAAEVDVFRSELQSADNLGSLKMQSSSAPDFARVDFVRSEAAHSLAESNPEPVAAKDRQLKTADPFASTGHMNKKMEISGTAADALNAAPLSRPAGEQKPEPASLVRAVLNDPLSSERAESGKSALVSEKTSRQVAAAFEELSEAFATRSKKSLEEMAEEMLRPMLQSWLDNNLPTLVEKLVREEIERVARGGYDVQR